MIADSTIDKVRDVNVADIIKAYLPLTRKGSTLMGCCPFHGERTPSMSVSEEKGLWHCFACHAGGDGIKFVMDKESYSFEEAVEHIARDHGISVEYSDRIQNEEERRESERKKVMSDVLNSADSPVYLKSDSLFGADVAARAAAYKGYVVFVEDVPDVMRMQMIGMDNTVASLGTSLTSGQIEIIRKMTDAVCFVPDADVPRIQGELPPGHRAVAENGKKAVMAGLMVTVREIPLGSRRLSAEEIHERWPDPKNQPSADDCVEPVKQDADSYFRSQEDFFDLEEVDYIVWLARKKFPLAMSMAQQQKLVAEIAELLAKVKDKQRRDLLCRELAKTFGTFSFWKIAANKSELESRAGNRETKGQDLDNQTRRYGFVIRDNCYWSIDKDQEKTRLSNFILEPLFHIIDQRDGTRMFRIRNRYEQSREIILRESELVRLSAFKMRLRSLGSYTWKSNIEKLDNVLEYCFENTKSAMPIGILGWQKEYGFYAFGNGIYADGAFHEVDEMGIVTLEDGTNYFLPAMSSMYKADKMAFQFERKIIHSRTSGLSMREFSTELTGIFGEHGMVAFCYLLATVFRDVCCSETLTFPHLNLFGEKGTGKTTLASLIQTFFIPFEKPMSLKELTVSALNDALTLASNYLTVIDEYKNDLHFSKINFLKTAFDGSGLSKKNKNGDKKAYKSVIKSAMAMCGQDKPTQDMGLFSRVIFLHLTRKDFSAEEKNRADEFINACKRSNTHLLMEVLNCRAIFEAQFPDMFRLTKEMLSEECGTQISVRLIDSWATALTALRILEPMIDINFSFRDALPVFARLCTEQNADLD